MVDEVTDSEGGGANGVDGNSVVVPCERSERLNRPDGVPTAKPGAARRATSRRLILTTSQFAQALFAGFKYDLPQKAAGLYTTVSEHPPCQQIAALV